MQNGANQECLISSMLPMKTMLAMLLWWCVVAVASGAENNVAPVSVLPRAHAHNDYEHVRPLFDALSQGFCGVEADVYLVDGELLVAHERKDVKAGRTLEALYLAPLRQRVQANGGRVYPGGPSLLLLVDVKGDAAQTYEALKKQLAPYAAMLTRFRAGRMETNAVTVVISGNRASDLIENDPDRYMAMDGRLGDLDGTKSVAVIPLVSDSWGAHFQWRGGQPSVEERAKLLQLVAKAHAQGRQIRWWAAPDRVEGWRELLNAGVDWINTDRLNELRVFLLDPERSASNQ